jgi:hypothetical protein
LPCAKAESPNILSLADTSFDGGGGGDGGASATVIFVPQAVSKTIRMVKVKTFDFICFVLFCLFYFESKYKKSHSASEWDLYLKQL